MSPFYHGRFLFILSAFVLLLHFCCVAHLYFLIITQQIHYNTIYHPLQIITYLLSINFYLFITVPPCYSCFLLRSPCSTCSVLLFLILCLYCGQQCSGMLP